jgi:hypothetical protein
MATALVSNTSGLILNALETGGSGVSPDAVGGNVKRPVPFPFGSNGSYAVGGSKTLVVRDRDLVNRQQAQQPSMPADEINEMIQKGWITVAYTAEAAATSIDTEDAFIAAL